MAVIQLEQAGDGAVLVHVDLLGGGNLGQTGHGHDLAGEGHKEACARTDLDITHGDGKAGGRLDILWKKWVHIYMLILS